MNLFSRAGRGIWDRFSLGRRPPVGVVFPTIFSPPIPSWDLGSFFPPKHSPETLREIHPSPSQEYRLAALKNLVKYSQFGGFLGVAFGNKVAVFSVVDDLQLLGTLKKHTAPVVDFCFDFQDRFMLTLDAAGAAYVWDLCSFGRVAE